MSKSNQFSPPCSLLRTLFAVGLTLALTAPTGAQDTADFPFLMAEQEQVAFAKPRLIKSGLTEKGEVEVVVGRSAILQTSRPYKRISVSEPTVADVKVVGERGAMVTALKAGSTQLVMWDDDENLQKVNVTVTPDLDLLRKCIETSFPKADIKVSAQGPAIVLKGKVRRLDDAQQIVALAAPHAEQVINLIQAPGQQQIMLHVTFAEVSRSTTSELGVNFGGTDGIGFAGNNIGQVNPFSFTTEDRLAVLSTSASVTLFGGGEIGQVTFGAFVNALRQNNLMRILAEPTLVAVSGQSAQLLAGGEFPIPVSQDEGSITIEFREFGVRLEFVPIVLGDGRIRLRLAPEVSDLDFTSAVRVDGFVVPGLSTRKVNTTVELADGQTLAIAGLLNHNVTATKDAVPVLGDIPVLGALFRSVRYNRKESELLVMVTPRIVEPVDEVSTASIPGKKWEHPDELQLFLFGKLGGEATDDANGPTMAYAKGDEPPLFYGSYGINTVGAVKKARVAGASEMSVMDKKIEEFIIERDELPDLSKSSKSESKSGKSTTDAEEPIQTLAPSTPALGAEAPESLELGEPELPASGDDAEREWMQM